MTTALRIGALDIAEAISAKIGSYVDMNFMQFLAVEGDHIQCWYMNDGGDGPTFQIDMRHSANGWTLHLTEHPSGTDQEIEVP